MAGLEEWLSTTEPGLSIDFPTFHAIQILSVFTYKNRQNPPLSYGFSRNLSTTKNHP